MQNILFIGQFTDAAGYANASRSYLRLLDKYLDHSKFNLKIFTIRLERDNYATQEEREIIKKYELTSTEIRTFCQNTKYTTFLCGLPNYYYIDSEQYPIKYVFDNENCIKSINSVFWETDVVPQIWVDVYQRKVFDKIIVACEDNKTVFSSQLGIPTDIVRTPIYDSGISSHRVSDGIFRILSISQWQYRKGFDILVRAYCQEFFNQTDTELLIKSYRAETAAGVDPAVEKQAVVNDIIKYKESCISYLALPTCKISFIPGFIDRLEIKKLYEKSDVFCLPTRGEGFGLTIAQAAASGLPCIVPELGGHVDFLDKQSNFFIQSRYEPAYNMPFSFYSAKDMNLIEPSLGDTRRKMREAYNLWKKGSLSARGESAKVFTTSFLSEQNSFESLTRALELHVEDFEAEAKQDRCYKKNLDSENEEHILICTIFRNREKHIARWNEQISQLLDNNKNIKFSLSIYENDSTDNTKVLLKLFERSMFQFYFETYENLNTLYYGSVKSEERVKNLANARNKCIEQAIQKIDNFTKILFIEPDFKYSTETANKILNAEKKNNLSLDIISGVSYMHGEFYDKWATRKDENEFWGVPINLEDIQPYWATFNGFCLYNAKPFYEGVRFGWINNRIKTFDCDTAVICENFREKGYNRIFLDSSAIFQHEI